MWLQLEKLFSGSKSLFFVLAGIQCAALVLVQAGQDYGWLGVVVTGLLLFPLFWLVPLAGWWFLPLSGMIWMMAFWIVTLLFSMLEGWAHRKWEDRVIQDALEESRKP